MIIIFALACFFCPLQEEGARVPPDRFGYVTLMAIGVSATEIGGAAADWNSETGARASDQVPRPSAVDGAFIWPSKVSCNAPVSRVSGPRPVSAEMRRAVRRCRPATVGGAGRLYKLEEDAGSDVQPAECVAGRVESRTGAPGE